VLDAAYRAQGFGCAPGSLGVGIGGDRMTSYMCAKEQLHRRLDDANPDVKLDALERRLAAEINTLGIGPMGYGGKTTVLGVKIGARHRAPASFFVSIAYMCWAFRRCTMKYSNGEVSYSQ
jgi:fumarate hydratase class I